MEARCAAPGNPRRTALGLCAALLLSGGAARAGKNDLQLLNLCKYAPPGTLMGQVSECSWVHRDAQGLIAGSVAPDSAAESSYRSLMSELGVVMAPRLQTPADTLGIAGFQITADVGWTEISRDKPFWNGVQGVPAQNPASQRPDGWLTTVGVFVRKGIWLPLPAFEIGGGAENLLDSSLFALQGYAKLALQEGFHDLPVPSLAVRGAISRVTGTDQVTLTIGSLDVSVSKQLSLGGTARFEPFGGWNYLWIDARGEVIDATPACDAYAIESTPAGQPVGASCAPAQAGTWDDLKANFVFPDQDVITRSRFFAGVKLKFAELVFIGQYAVATSGGSRDEKKANGAKDESDVQQSLSLSGGFDF